MAGRLEVQAERRAPGSAESNRKRPVVVLFTTPADTLLALRSAAKLADGLGAEIRVVLPCVVPFPLPLDEPPVHCSVLSGRMLALAREAGVACTIDIRLCRDRWTACGQAMPAGSLVLIGRRPRWWEFRERGLGGKLRQEGHHVSYAE